MPNPNVRSLVLAAALAGCVAAGAEAATSPVQPKTGFGASTDATGEVVKRGLGRASSATYAFHMASAPAQPRTIVVLLHAWGAVNPIVYGNWIEHLARRGHLVLVPAFQAIGRTRPGDASEVAAGLVKDALAELASDPQARPDASRMLLIGHSAGAGIAANLAATAAARGLPIPKLVYALMPGGIASDDKSRGIQLADLSAIPAGTALVTMTGDRENQAADRVSRRLLREATNVPAGMKLLMRSASDDHGFPALSATLASPASPNEAYDAAAIKVPPDPPVDRKAPRQPRPKWAADMVLSGEQTVLVGQLQRNVTDTLDWLSYWRSFDMLAAAALAGTEMSAVRADPALVDMGRWSDGWPVRRMTAETPKAAEAAAPAAGAGGVARPATPMIQSKQPVTRRQPVRRATR